jgi:hypothetical protein
VMPESSHSDPHLHRIDSRIRVRQSRVRDVHIATLQRPGILSEKVKSESGRGSEVYVGSPRRYVFVGKQRSTVQFEVRYDIATSGEVPLQAQGIHSPTVGSIGFLNDDECGNGIENVLKTPFEKAWAMGTCENPPVAHPSIPDSIVRGAAGNGGPAAGPNLKFISAVLGTPLRQGNICAKNRNQDQSFLHAFGKTIHQCWNLTIELRQGWLKILRCTHKAEGFRRPV